MPSYEAFNANIASDEPDFNTLLAAAGWSNEEIYGTDSTDPAAPTPTTYDLHAKIANPYATDIPLAVETDPSA